MAMVDNEYREKNQATFVSVGASLLLTFLKLAAGLLSGSLGLLAEAAHSGLDFVASLITFVSVRIARRPADEEHPFGHERFENLSAVIQGMLLLGTAAWIAYESVIRLFFESVHVSPSPVTFGVMLFTIATDIWRSRMLLEVARKYRSRALEADALNFRADLLSSTAVVAGLSLVAVGEAIGRGGLLNNADAIAALVVAVIIVYKAGGLLLSSVNILLDRAPTGLEEQVRRAASSVPGVLDAPSVRARESGSRTFAEVVVSVPRTTSAAEAHEFTRQVEDAIRGVDERAEALVHVEPQISGSESAADAVRATALRRGFSTHHEKVWQDEDGSLEASLHVEVEPGLSLQEAHQKASELGAAIREDDRRIKKVTTHIEPAEPDPGRSREITEKHPETIEEIKRIVTGLGVEANPHEVRLYETERGGLDAVLHCDFPPPLNVEETHVRTELIERTLRERMPILEHVVVHAEPGDEIGGVGKEQGP